MPNSMAGPSQYLEGMHGGVCFAPFTTVMAVKLACGPLRAMRKTMQKVSFAPWIGVRIWRRTDDEDI